MILNIHETMKSLKTRSKFSLPIVVIAVVIVGCTAAAPGTPTNTPTTIPTPAPTSTSAPTPLPADLEALAAGDINELIFSPTPAIHTSLWWNEEIAERDLYLVEELGFEWIKQIFPWREIEGAEKGQYDWWRTDRIVEDSEERGINMIIRLDRQPFWSQVDGGAVPLDNAPPADLNDFRDFCFAVADRYQGRIAAYQVWNEPNLAREWGEQAPNPTDYVDLLRHCYEGIKEGDPDAIIISAGMAPTGTGPPEAMPDDQFIRGMYEAGGADYFDLLGVNAPGYAAPPNVAPEVTAADPELGGHRWNAFRHVEDIRQIMIEYGDEETQIAILEMGWTTDPIHERYSWFSVSEEVQARNLVGAYTWAWDNWRPWISFMTIIYIPDPYWTEDDEEYWWAITLPDWPETIRRPAFDALKALSERRAHQIKP